MMNTRPLSECISLAISRTAEAIVKTEPDEPVGILLRQAWDCLWRAENKNAFRLTQDGKPATEELRWTEEQIAFFAASQTRP